MADIINPQAIHITRDELRQVAALMLKHYRSLKQAMLRIAVFESLTTGNVNADTVVDGALEAGQVPFTKLKVAEFKFACETLITATEGNGVIQTIASLAEGGVPII